MRVGSLTMRLRSDLRHAQGGEERRDQSPAAKEKRPDVSWQKAQEVSFEIDLRGMTVEEALTALDKHLDDALLAGLTQVRIIHGKGTGALRKAVSEYLRSDSRVAGSRLGEAGEGGAGVTVAKVRT